MSGRQALFRSPLFLSALAVIGIPLSYWLYLSGYDLIDHSQVMTTFQDRRWQRLFAVLSDIGRASTQSVICLVVFASYYVNSNYRLAKVWLYSIPVYLTAGLVGYIIKVILGRPRPKLHDTMYDFQWFEMPARLHSLPSGHTITTFAWLACLAPFYPRSAGAAMFSYAVVTSWARVGVGSHYLGDVIIGAVIGYICGCYLSDKWQLGKY